ncbi:uncharacterized protein LOC142227003 isoform X1 [Haematobia irritans]|uniref:uncharacterized protein LOC142227003 isoform X1 n=1 Tax=Haematobia irritans TaxID=7368 RepID=UPI003F4F6A41
MTIMKSIWVILFVATILAPTLTIGAPNISLGSPLTKWFKTDNNTYYIEPEQKVIILILNLILLKIKFKKNNCDYNIRKECIASIKRFSWQQSNEECKKRKLNLITLNQLNGDELLNKYLEITFTPIPDFWLRTDISKDIADMLPSMMENFFKLKIDELDVETVSDNENPNNCVLTKDGAIKGCDISHGFICKASSNANNGQNIQNIVLRFS